MNKRIKKKKAKQAELRKQQELERLLQNPELIQQCLASIARSLSYVSLNFAKAFAEVSENFRILAKNFETEA